MNKFLFQSFLTIFIIFISAIIFFTYVGYETAKFDNLIKNKANKTNKYAKLDFNKIKIYLDLKEFDLLIKLQKPNILIKGGDYKSSVTVSLTANFQKPAPEGALLQAFPKLNHRTKRMAFVDCEILADNTCVFSCSSIIRVMFKDK